MPCVHLGGAKTLAAVTNLKTEPGQSPRLAETTIPCRVFQSRPRNSARLRALGHRGGTDLRPSTADGARSIGVSPSRIPGVEGHKAQEDRSPAARDGGAHVASVIADTAAVTD